ncbi:YncE family protein [Enterococcus sp. LJL128]
MLFQPLIRESNGTETNTSAALYSTEEQLAILQNFPKLYQALEEPKAQQLFIIPGLLTTKTLSSNQNQTASVCNEMDQQGVAVTENYLIVSAYCHDKKHNSVLYVLDKSSGSYLKTIVLQGKPHVGGISYDSEFQNLWICARKDNQAQLVAVQLRNLEAYDFSKSSQPIAYDQSVLLLEIKRASFVTWHQQHLYVGYFDENRDGVIEKYALDNRGAFKTGSQGQIHVKHKTKISPIQSALIDQRIQGAAFYKDYLLLSQSNGGRNPSKLIILEDYVEGEVFIDQETAPSIDMPERMEQIASDGKYLYTVYESSSSFFRKFTKNKVDRILKLELSELIKK